MKHKSQKEIVKKILLSQGEITRNICIRELYITRLSGIIFRLKKEGWKFNEGFRKYERGIDYVYYLIESPYKRVEYTVPELGKTITIYE